MEIYHAVITREKVVEKKRREKNLTNFREKYNRREKKGDTCMLLYYLITARQNKCYREHSTHSNRS